ncbi:hypothetical protein [Prevotella sp. kh1p2]|uniref:hypothetical protein n=1 Tax=Prevotella sp. kh1p2 TaxID=1761883 RepID=UPI0008D1E26A|nr:hypothetical protein [Prevotella sp. kh1p2]SES71016.1 hypothetical protein SAMN04487825_102178 [Prevotella sp. kh1p2]SNU10400.1 hypothetical protein SAMN06298210_102162 [Prevotellaceae bacterium KH2P17]
MEKITAIVKLMAQTGLFFANADGIYQRREKEYIDEFVSGIKQIGDITAEMEADIQASLDKKYTLNEIVDGTREVLDGFSEPERQAILKSIRGFINKVIRADGHVHPLEHENYKLWKTAFGLH